jgi:hypothetical protein
VRQKGETEKTKTDQEIQNDQMIDGINQAFKTLAVRKA